MRAVRCHSQNQYRPQPHAANGSTDDAKGRFHPPFFRCTICNLFAQTFPDISRPIPDYPASFPLVITLPIRRRPRQRRRCATPRPQGSKPISQCRTALKNNKKGASLSACSHASIQKTIYNFGAPIFGSACSKANPSASNSPSAKALPNSCMPTGIPLSAPRPTGMESPGRPARLSESV